MGEVNKHGVSRYIPEPVTRQVRQECGFGCVVCGFPLTHYDHFAPEFADITDEHKPEGIALLCGKHHDMRTRNCLSTETVARCRRSPVALRRGWSWGLFDFMTTRPKVFLGSWFDCCYGEILSVGGVPLLSISEPSEPGGPCEFSADLRDVNGEQIVKIIKNEIHFNSSAWDMTAKGNVFEVSSGRRHVALLMILQPPNGLRLEKLCCSIHGSQVRIDGKSLFAETPILRNTISVNSPVTSRVTLSGNLFSGQVDPVRISKGEHGGAVDIKGIVKTDHIEKLTVENNTIGGRQSGGNSYLVKSSGKMRELHISDNKIT